MFLLMKQNVMGANNAMFIALAAASPWKMELQRRPMWRIIVKNAGLAKVFAPQLQSPIRNQAAELVSYENSVNFFLYFFKKYY